MSIPARGVIARWGDRLTLSPAAPRISLGEGDTPCVESLTIGPALGLGVAAFQARGIEPDRLVQGPRHGGRCLGGAARGEPRDHLRVDRQHERIRGGVRRTVRIASSCRRAGRTHRVGQAAPGARPRCDGGECQRRFRCRAARRARTLRTPPRDPREQRQPESDRRSEDCCVRDRGRARRRSGRARTPGRQRRQHHRVLARLSRGLRCGTRDAPAAHDRRPGIGRGAARARASGR